MRAVVLSLSLTAVLFASAAVAADKPIPPIPPRPRTGTWSVAGKPGTFVQITRMDDSWVSLQFGARGIGQAGREKDAFVGVMREPVDGGDRMRLVRFAAIANNTLRVEIRDGWSASNARVETWSPESGDTALFVGTEPVGGDRDPMFGEYVYVEELPEALYKVPPSYPDEARRAGVDGTVLVQALIGKDGHVKDTRITNSIPMLDDAAVRAVRQWTFVPAKSKDKPVAVWVAVPVKFSLK